ncbi:MAG: ROK family transcriptional regulator [Clostridia bacterium]|nr:ROK family transcriptional regulator [Clostridia bacterium]
MPTSFLSHADAALRNRNAILHFVKQNGPVSRTDIWERMGISRASVTQVIRQLQEANLILEEGEGDSTGGRKPRFLKFNGAAKKLFAFDWSSRTLALIDLDSNILFDQKIPDAMTADPIPFFSFLNEQIDQIFAMQLCPEEEIMGLSISLPGLIDHKNLTVLHSAETGWKNVRLNDYFSDRFGENIFLERITNTLALGAYHQLFSASIDHFQLMILGRDGIGVSTVVCGHCRHGASYMHGELGHVKLPASDILCSCGQCGCLEAVIRDVVQKNGGKLCDEALALLSIAVSTSVNLSDPSAVILVGSYVDQMTEEQKARLISLSLEKVTGEHFREFEIRYADDVKQLAFHGLAVYAFDQYFSID